MVKITLPVAAVIAIAVAAVIGGAYVLTSGHNDNASDSPKALTELPSTYARLNVLGNVDGDDDIDNDDLTYLQAVIDKSKEVNFYCDVNHDGSVNDSDVTALNKLISKEKTTVYFIDAKDKVSSASVPINNLMVGFRRTTEMVAALGCTNQIVALTNGGLNQFGFVGFSDVAKSNIINPGQNNDSNVNSETAMTIYNNYKDSGLTVLGDANGMDKNMESIFNGLPVDVLRLPCTESTRIAEGMITLGYMLSFNSTYKSIVEAKTAAWVEWNDKTDKTIADALKSLSTKETGLVILHNKGGSSPSDDSMNLRGEGLSECEISKLCGCDNLARIIGTGPEAKYTQLSNEAILHLQSNYGMKKIVMEAQTLYQKIMKAYGEATDDAGRKAALETIDTMVSRAVDHTVMQGYTGDFFFIGQEICNGPEVVLYKMYVASIFIPALSSVFTEEYINGQFDDYLNALNPDSVLKGAKIITHS